ncbi:MAG: hypothetical protein ACTSO7_12045 [Candidatus Heimdallarchaeota archaeon]
MKKKGFIILFILVISSFIGLMTPSFVVELSADETIEEGFEDSSIPDWLDYAHESYYSINTNSYYTKDGSKSLMVTPSSSSGQTYDGVQYDCTISNGSIEAWFYPKSSNYLIPALWIRTTGFDPVTNPSFASGYWIRFTQHTAYLNRRDIGGFEHLNSCETGWIISKWWHLKLKATGTLIEAWVTQSETFTEKPQMSHDTVNDAIKYTSGKIGFTSRTTMPSSYYKTYIDGLKIINNDVQYEPQPAPENDNLYAIIIGAGTIEEKRFTRDPFGFYSTLTQWYGLAADHTMLITPDIVSDGQTVPRNKKTTKTNIEDGFSWIKGEVDSEDTVIVFWTGHGDFGADQFEISSQEGITPYVTGYKTKSITSYTTEYLSEYDLNEILNTIPCCEMFVFLGPCYSGQFLDLLPDTDRIIYTSANSIEPADAGDGHSYWPWAIYRALDPDLNLVDADINGDWRISFEELFDYCFDFVSYYQTPQRNPGGFNQDNTFLYDQPF